MVPAGNKAMRISSVNHTTKKFIIIVLFIIKPVANRNLNSDLRDLTEILKSMKLEITGRKNYEDNSDRIAKNDNFLPQDCLDFFISIVQSTREKALHKK